MKINVKFNSADKRNGDELSRLKHIGYLSDVTNYPDLLSSNYSDNIGSFRTGDAGRIRLYAFIGSKRKCIANDPSITKSLDEHIIKAVSGGNVGRSILYDSGLSNDIYIIFRQITNVVDNLPVIDNFVDVRSRDHNSLLIATALRLSRTVADLLSVLSPTTYESIYSEPISTDASNIRNQFNSKVNNAVRQISVSVNEISGGSGYENMVVRDVIISGPSSSWDVIMNSDWGNAVLDEVNYLRLLTNV